MSELGERAPRLFRFKSLENTVFFWRRLSAETPCFYWEDAAVEGKNDNP